MSKCISSILCIGSKQGEFFVDNSYEGNFFRNVI